jgi:hypothetical protein
VVDKTSNSNIIDKKKTLEIMIPYCGNCSRKTKKEGMAKNEYCCDVLIDTPMKGVVTSDTDGTHCVELGVYRPIQQRDLIEIK